MARVRNPLEPMSSAVTMIVTLIAVVTVLGVFGSMFVDGVSVLGIGDTTVCVTDTTMTEGSDAPSHMGVKAAPGASMGLDASPRYCTDAPSTVQGLLNTATQVPSFAFTVGALLLVLRLIRGAEGDGLYTAGTARRLRRVGWWLLAGSVLAAIAESVGEKALIHSLSRGGDVSALSGLISWDAPYMAILTGLGVLSFARIMRVGVAMREDLDGTV
ncbi:DUF2975 domain-containing protein [Streptomyces sp. NBC_00151]|jgi:hypothetical protein|uniref:DUF2975 domain-containing protein n=1 Tax=Streptomyces sp. NBC_01393 TaxID=2903851 RepID=A0AAU3I8Y4_9ACTN|nr:DUF2975 domain-containing protein [Streptomyces sp. NBC_00151]WRZ37681.1 DUF2975 domain-containing protein [Streptomyces sp. NBC_00151]